MSTADTTLAALKQIQAKIKVPKSQWNDFSKFHYRNLEDILKAFKELPEAENCVINFEDDIVEIGGRIFLKATATICCLDGRPFSTQAFAEIPESKKGMDLSQITGSSSSYARKYAANALLALDDTKDVDSQDNRQAAPQQQTRPPQQQPTEPPQVEFPQDTATTGDFSHEFVFNPEDFSDEFQNLYRKLQAYRSIRGVDNFLQERLADIKGLAIDELDVFRDLARQKKASLRAA